MKRACQKWSRVGHRGWTLVASLVLLGCSSGPNGQQGDAPLGDHGGDGDTPGGDFAAGDSCLPWEPCAQGDEDCCWCQHTRLSTSTYADYPDIEVDSTGAYHVVWNQSTIQAVSEHRYGEYEIYYLREGEQPVQISNSPTRMNYWAKLALGPDDRPHAVWENRELLDSWSDHFPHAFVEYTALEGGTWTLPIDISGASDIEAASIPDINVDGVGEKHVIFCENNVTFPLITPGQLAYAHSEAHHWKPVMRKATLGLVHSRILSDKDNIPIIFTEFEELESITDVYYDHRMGISRFDGVSWSHSEPIFSQASLDYLLPQAFIVDSVNHLHVLWWEHDGEIVHNFYSSWDGMTWSAPLNVTPDAIEGGWASMAVDSLNRPHVVWQDLGLGPCEEFLSIWHRYRDGTSWTTPRLISRCEVPQTVFDTWQANWGPDIAIGPDDKIHVAWEHARIGLNYIDYTSCRLEDL